MMKWRYMKEEGKIVPKWMSIPNSGVPVKNLKSATAKKAAKGGAHVRSQIFHAQDSATVKTTVMETLKLILFIYVVFL